MPTTILVIEDEPDLRNGLRHNLQLDGFQVETAADGSRGLDLVRTAGPDLVLLDLMLPGLPGSEVLRELRRTQPGLPVIILSAKDEGRDRVRGLDLGADDYVTKPFALDELVARIRAVLRRSSRAPGSTRRQVWDFDGLRVDFTRFTVTRQGTEHQLSRYESEILRMLIDRRTQVVTRRQLLEQVWGYTRVPATRTVDNHVARLRKKIEADVDDPKHVVTVHGLGYRFESEPIE